MFKLPRRLVTEGIPRKQWAPREEPKPPPAAQALVGEVFDDESTIWRTICMSWPSEHQDLAVYYYRGGGEY